MRFVYEFGDTEGEPVAGADANPLLAVGTVRSQSWDDMKLSASNHLVRVTEAVQGPLAAGFAVAGHRIEAKALQPSKGSSHRWDVVINAAHDEPTKFATLAHELGHIYCGHVGAHPKQTWPARHLSRAACELEAEAVAWLVCNRNGVVPRSAEYLADYVHPAALQEINMFAIFEAANRVESRTARKSAQ